MFKIIGAIVIVIVMWFAARHNERAQHAPPSHRQPVPVTSAKAASLPPHCLHGWSLVVVDGTWDCRP